MSDRERIFYRVGDSGYKDLQIVGLEGSDRINISLEDDWCGDTETGFGAEIDMDLTREEARGLVGAINKWLKTNTV